MATSEISGSGSAFSMDRAFATLGPQADNGRFHSILFERPEQRAQGELTEPDFFVDLNLDQVLESMTTGREQYSLEPFFYAPLHEIAAVSYRHEVFRDVEKPEVLAAITKFADAMKRMRERLEWVQKLHYELQRQAWFLAAVDVYCGAVRSLVKELDESGVASRGLRRFRDYIRVYAASEPFTTLVAATQEVKEALAGIRYRVRIEGGRVTVTKYERGEDYSAQIQDTFARFQQGAVGSYLVALLDHVEMNHVEARILDGVAELHPEVFASRAAYCARHAGYLDAIIARFDREVQFYLAYLELIERLRAAGLPFCYPRVSAHEKELATTETFDIALANKLVADDRPVVCNDFYLQPGERMFVVSGPNNGGKTTFARTFGQLHYLASLGLLVPGREARLFLPDQIFTHFEREENIETLRGKFDDELVRVHEILERATSSSIIVMNESFNSTTLSDALFVGTEVMKLILELGSLGVYVTFVDEIASLSDAIVSMVTQIVPENPAERTFKILRQRADGLAYAWAIAEKNGLTYERLIERIGA